jgi:hypothetical protein
VGISNTALQSDMRRRTSELAAFAFGVQFAGNRCFARTKDRLSAGRVQVHERKQDLGAAIMTFGILRQEGDPVSGTARGGSEVWPVAKSSDLSTASTLPCTR